MLEVAGGILLAMVVLALLPLIISAAVMFFGIIVAGVALSAACYVIFIVVPNAPIEETIVMTAILSFIGWVLYTIFKDRDSMKEEIKPECHVVKEGPMRDSKGRFMKREVS